MVKKEVMERRFVAVNEVVCGSACNQEEWVGGRAQMQVAAFICALWKMRLIGVMKMCTSGHCRKYRRTLL